MSQSITITGRFTNNKTRTIGLHNPHNDRVVNSTEMQHLFDMFNKHLNPVIYKFKEIIITIQLQQGWRCHLWLDKNNVHGSICGACNILISDKERIKTCR